MHIYIDLLYSYNIKVIIKIVKIWAENWHLQLVFVGHCAPITSLAYFPYGPMFMSASEDKTIRVWNLETCDQVDRFLK